MVSISHTALESKKPCGSRIGEPSDPGRGQGGGGAWTGPPPSSVPQCLHPRCGPLRLCWGWSWWTLLFEAGGRRQQPGGPGVRAAKDRPACVLKASPSHSVGSRGGVEQMCCLGNRWQVHRPRKALPPRSRPPTPRALAIWCAGTVVEAECPAQHSQPALLPTTWKSRKAVLPASPVSPGFPLLSLLLGLKPGSAALSSEEASLSLSSPCKNSSSLTSCMIWPRVSWAEEPRAPTRR